MGFLHAPILQKMLGTS